MANYIAGPRKGKSAAPSPLTGDAAALYAAMTELLRVYQFRDRDRVGYHGLTITQCYVMEILTRRGALTLNDLSAEMYLDKSTLSRVIDGLERKGAVQRTPNPADGRSAFIEPTRDGARRYERVESDIVTDNAQILSGFSTTVRRQLIALITALSRAARERHLSPVTEETV